MELGSLLGGGAAGWIGKTLVERYLRQRDRRTERQEANKEEQGRLLLHLNGQLYNRWLWLADHPDAANQAKATPAANEIGDWLYQYSSYFPESQRPAMVVLAGLTFHLATNQRAQVLLLRHTLCKAVWQQLHDYQPSVEKDLGLDTQ